MMDPGPMDAASLRNFKDFLQLFNVIAESCFLRCVHTFNTRGLTEEEVLCMSRCADKHVKVNNRVMEIYLEVQPLITKKRIEEMNALQEKQKATEVSQATENQSDKTES